MKTYGYNTAVDISGTPYKIATGSLQYRSDTHDVTDTEGSFGVAGSTQPRRERGIGLGEAEVRMSAFLDPTIALHVTPLSIQIQTIIPVITVWVNGRENTPDILIDVLIDDVTKDPVGDPQQPNKVTFHGFCQNFVEAGVGD